MKDLPDHFLFNGSLFCAEGKYEFIFICYVELNICSHLCVALQISVCMDVENV